MFDSARGEVPYAVELTQVPDTFHSEVQVPARRVTFEKISGDRIRLVYERDTLDPVPEALVIHTPLVDFDKRVSVSGSNDRAHWEPLRRDAPIFDYQRFIDVRNTRVTFDSRPYRYYRLQFENVTSLRRSPFSEVVRGTRGATDIEYERFTQASEPFRIEDVTFVRTHTEIRPHAARRQRWSVVIDTQYVDSADECTHVVLRSSRQPLHQLTVWSSSRNYSRRVTVEAAGHSAGSPRPEHDEAWTVLARGHIRAIDAGGIRSRDSTLDIGGPHRFRWYRLTIVDNDSPPLTIDSVTAHGVVHRLVFFPEKASTLTLCYGASSVGAPRYDIAEVLSRSPRLNHQPWTAEPEIVRQTKPEKKRVRIMSGSTAFTIALLLMVAVLAWALIGAMRKVEKPGEGS